MDPEDEQSIREAEEKISKMKRDSKFFRVGEVQGQEPRPKRSVSVSQTTQTEEAEIKAKGSGRKALFKSTLFGGEARTIHSVSSEIKNHQSPKRTSPFITEASARGAAASPIRVRTLELDEKEENAKPSGTSPTESRIAIPRETNALRETAATHKQRESSEK